MSRALVFIYSLLAYTIGMAGLVYYVLFMGAWSFMPHHINSGTAGDTMTAITINALLMLAFALQHSVMARPWFKNIITRILPQASERAHYVLASGVVLALMGHYWQPIEGSLWQTEGWLASLLFAGYIFGWLFAVISTFLINHFELFGLQQSWYHLKNEPVPQAQFVEKYFYTLVRHPLQLGVLMGIWFTPHMTGSHLCMAVMMTVYIFVGLVFEEKDLEQSLGSAYTDYKKRVPMIIPFSKR